MAHSSRSGFTLAELLIVISIISLLSSVVLSTVGVAKRKAYISALSENGHQIQNQVDIARSTYNLPIMDITIRSCTECAFIDGAAIMSQPVALATLEDSWKKLGFPHSPLDPWGRPYLLDENEGESSFTPCTVHDIIYSAGPNGIWESFSYNGDQVTAPGEIGQGLGDDFYYNLTFYNCRNS